MKNMRPISIFYICGIIVLLSACNLENKKAKTLYTQQDTLNLNGHKFSKSEFNLIVDNFPRLYQDEDEVLHPDSLYASETPLSRDLIDSNGQKLNISFDSDAGQDRYFALYAHFLAIKNKGTKFENLRKYLSNSYEAINTIFERLNRGGTHYIHQSSCIPAYVEYDIYAINNSVRQPVFTKKTRAERYEFITDLKQQIESESTLADMSYEFENEKIADLINKLNEAIVNDYVLLKARVFAKPYLQDFKETQSENGK